MAKILITGASGFLGWNLGGSLRGSHEVCGTFCGHPVEIRGCRMERLDLASARGTVALVRRVTPDVIIHAAAMIDIDRCEREREQASRVNEEATRVVAELAAELGARLIYFSTDMVFDGRKGMYTEEDEAGPINYYGETKLAGERWAIEKCPGALVLRLALMYGRGNEAHGSFIGWMLKSLERGEPLGLFTDQYRTPLFVGDVCSAVKRILYRTELSGLYHLAGPERVNRYEFGERLAEEFSFQEHLFRPVRMEDVKSLLPRPKDLSMNNGKAERDLGVKFMRVREGLRAVRRGRGSDALPA